MNGDCQEETHVVTRFKDVQKPCIYVFRTPWDTVHYAFVKIDFYDTLPWTHFANMILKITYIYFYKFAI